MKNFLLLFTLLISHFSFAQDTTKGAIAGKLMDKEISGERSHLLTLLLKEPILEPPPV